MKDTKEQAKDNKCLKCGGKGGYMEETAIKDRCYSSTSSGELNGPFWTTCDWCNGTGKKHP